MIRFVNTLLSIMNLQCMNVFLINQPYKPIFCTNTSNLFYQLIRSLVLYTITSLVLYNHGYWGKDCLIWWCWVIFTVFVCRMVKIVATPSWWNVASSVSRWWTARTRISGRRASRNRQGVLTCAGTAIPVYSVVTKLWWCCIWWEPNWCGNWWVKTISLNSNTICGSL